MPDDRPAVIARVAGRALEAVFAAILVVRRPRPIHSRGVRLRGEIRWLGTSVRSGMSWVDDQRGPVRVVARWSRSIGLPTALPDIQGLALRVEADGRQADIELASTGIGVPSRFVLFPHKTPWRAHLNTLLPYRGSEGPLLLAARTVTAPSAAFGAIPTAEWTLRLFFARPLGKWHPFADVRLHATGETDDADLRFDAVEHPLPGAGTYAWTRALRQPSYRLARRNGSADFAPSEQ